MSNLIAFLPDERWCANLLRKIRWTRYNHVTCIYLHSQNIKKNGCYRSYQKFYCKCCKKNFNDKTDTIFHYSHTPIKKWFIVQYLFIVSCGIFHNADIIADIPYYICYRFVVCCENRKFFQVTYIMMVWQIISQHGIQLWINITYATDLMWNIP